MNENDDNDLLLKFPENNDLSLLYPEMSSYMSDKNIDSYLKKDIDEKSSPFYVKIKNINATNENDCIEPVTGIEFGFMGTF